MSRAVNEYDTRNIKLAWQVPAAIVLPSAQEEHAEHKAKVTQPLSRAYWSWLSIYDVSFSHDRLKYLSVHYQEAFQSVNALIDREIVSNHTWYRSLWVL